MTIDLSSSDYFALQSRGPIPVVALLLPQITSMNRRSIVRPVGVVEDGDWGNFLLSNSNIP